jgi:hypothetical protein
LERNLNASYGGRLRRNESSSCLFEDMCSHGIAKSRQSPLIDQHRPVDDNVGRDNKEEGGTEVPEICTEKLQLGEGSAGKGEVRDAPN